MRPPARRGRSRIRGEHPRLPRRSGGAVVEDRVNRAGQELVGRADHAAGGRIDPEGEPSEVTPPELPQRRVDHAPELAAIRVMRKSAVLERMDPADP